MIKQLRKKFVIINMSLVAVVLLIVFAAIAFSALQQMNSRVEGALAQTLEMHMDDVPDVPEIGKRNADSFFYAAQRREFLPCFCVQLDSENVIVDSMQNNASVESSVMADAAAQAALSGKGSGLLSEYALQYAIRYSSAGMKIAFVDVSTERANLTHQLFTLLIADIAGLAAFFFISVFLSSFALRPVEQAWERQRQFIADASHELKTPLTVVLANTDLVLSHPQEAVSSQARWLENTKAESLRMKGLVDDMLFLARADMAAPVKMERISLSDAVWEATLPFEAVAYEAGRRLETDVAGDIAIVGNAGQIRQLVGILLDNAIKYAGKGGTITTKLFSTDDGITLFVNNTGEPIDPAKLPHLFERFYRADAARESSTGGYGLGLAIAQSIADAHHANLLVTSSPVSGTTFTVEWRESHGRQR